MNAVQHFQTTKSFYGRQKTPDTRCAGNQAHSWDFLHIPEIECTDHDYMPYMHALQAAPYHQKNTITFAVTLNQWPHRTPASMQKRM